MFVLNTPTRKAALKTDANLMLWTGRTACRTVGRLREGTAEFEVLRSCRLPKETRLHSTVAQGAVENVSV